MKNRINNQTSSRSSIYSFKRLVFALLGLNYSMGYSFDIETTSNNIQYFLK